MREPGAKVTNKRLEGEEVNDREEAVDNLVKYGKLPNG